MRRMMLPLIAVLTLGSPVAGEPQDGRITLEALYAPDRSQRIDYDGSTPYVIGWVDDDAYLESRDGQLLRVLAGSGDSGPAVDRGALLEAFRALPGFAADEQVPLATPTLVRLARGERALVNYAADLFLVEPDLSVRRLTFDPAEEVGEELSPDGRFVSFVRDYNLWLIELASGRERALTADGGPELFYGRLDWVYQEEIYGRGNFKGYWWSPDSSRIAFLRLDESPVKEFTVVDHLPTRLGLEVTNYPKAGDPNPTVTIGIVRASGGETVWVENSRYQPIEHLVVRVDWHPTDGWLVYQVQDREQTWLDLDVADPNTGASQTLMRETSPAFVQELGPPTWMADGTFLWFSERSGFKHLYHYALVAEAETMPSGTRLLHQVTDGRWEARSLEGIAPDGTIYFSGTERNPIGSDLYSVRPDGSGLTRLTERKGTHSVTFNPSMSLYVDSWSDVRTPPQVRLHGADGGEVRVIEANPAPELGELALGEVELLQVPTRDGFQMEAMIIRPPDFDAARKYPVLQYNYGGPHAPTVRDSWGGTTYLWHQMLAQNGYVIWICDNRSASGKGIAPTWEAYGQMGVVELRDIEDGIAWLKGQPWVDGDRIGIHGWSYGGFMAAYALTHSTSFKAGIAGAPVTDWRLYDSIYTERYMKMPQNNPEGYDATSVVKAAANLHGSLFLIHGTMDDNVHMQNSMQLIYELQKAGKEFELMVYPRSRHGVSDPELAWHLRRAMTQFILESL